MQIELFRRMTERKLNLAVQKKLSVNYVTKSNENYIPPPYSTHFAIVYYKRTYCHIGNTYPLEDYSILNGPIHRLIILWEIIYELYCRLVTHVTLLFQSRAVS